MANGKQQSIFGAVFDGPDSIFGRVFGTDGQDEDEGIPVVPETIHFTLTEEHATRLLAGAKLTYRHAGQTFIIQKK